MALFKIFKGTSEELKQVSCKEGYAYFTIDDSKLHIDVKTGSQDEVGNRLTLNAKVANSLMTADGDIIDVDDLFLADMIAAVDQGGTGLDELTVNALLVGNGIDPVKLVSIEAGSILVGDADDGIAGLKGVGALFASAEGVPQIGVLPLELGGTGGATATAARQNLDVYNKKDVDDKIDEAVTKAYSFTLRADGWITANDKATYELSVTGLTCGQNGNVPPIITYTSNKDEYNKIDEAEADPILKKITFTVLTAEGKPENDIGIIVIDVK